MIQDLNPNFWINPDSDVCQIVLKMLWIRYLLGICHTPSVVTRSSALGERPRDASCLSVVSFNIATAVFLLLITAASDLLVHKILLNSVLLSPIVYGACPTKTPRTNTPRS